MPGQSTTALPLTPAITHVLAISDDSTVRQAFADLVAQILARPEFQGLLGALNVFVGEWDASSGAFPASSLRGQYWRVGAGGTVDGTVFSTSDILISLVDDASTTTFAGNWHKAEYAGFAHSHEISEIPGLQAALNALAPLADPALTGTPTAPTATPGTNTTQIATTAFVAAAIAALIDGAPGALDTLQELSAALGDDSDFAATTVAALAGKLAAAQNLSDLADPDEARGNLSAASDVQGAKADKAAPATIVRSFRVPQLGPRIAARQVWRGSRPVAFYTRHGARIDAPGQASYRVPRIAGMTRATFSTSGKLINGSGPFGAVRPSFRVPRIGGYASAVFNLDGRLVEAEGPNRRAANGVEVDTRDDPAVTEGEPYTAPVHGAYSGQVHNQVHIRRGNIAAQALTFGPDSAVFVVGSGGAGFVRRQGQTHPIKWRADPLNGNTDLHLLLVVGQSLGQGYIDAGPTYGGDRAVPWPDLVGQHAFMFAPSDGMDRGPRPFQLPPRAVNKDVEIADTEVAALTRHRGSYHGMSATFGQTCLETCAAALLGQHFQPRAATLSAVVGTSGTGIADFAVGTEHMASVEKIIDAASGFADAMDGRTLKVWLVWNQGEQDHGNVTIAAWKTAWQAIRDHIETYTTGTAG